MLVEAQIFVAFENDWTLNLTASLRDQLFSQLWGAGANAFPVPPSQYNPLDEPSPLGLRLRKSPSLLDLIQMKLSQGTCNLATTQSDNLVHETNKDAKSNASSGTTDKMKASNFPASFLRIGRWEVLVMV